MIAPIPGPTAIPTGEVAPKSAIAVPRRRRGVTSRIAASITPVLPSWNPTSRRLSPSCHGVRLSATAANTTASTTALRMITALRLYLSAQTPHSGTIGRPSTNTSELSTPIVGPMSAFGTLHALQVEQHEREDLAHAEGLHEGCEAVEDEQHHPGLPARRGAVVARAGRGSCRAHLSLARRRSIRCCRSIDGVPEPPRLVGRPRVQDGIARTECGPGPPGRDQEIGAVAVLEDRHQRLQEGHPALVAQAAERRRRRRAPAGPPRGRPRRGPGPASAGARPSGEDSRTDGDRRGSACSPWPGTRQVHARPVGGGNGGTTPLPAAVVLRSSVSVMRLRSEPAIRIRSE